MSLCKREGGGSELFQRITGSTEWLSFYFYAEQMQKMGAAARKDFEQKYGADVNYEKLVEVYREAERTA